MLLKKVIFVLKLLRRCKIYVSLQEFHLTLKLLLLGLCFSKHALIIFGHLVISLWLNPVEVGCSGTVKFIQLKLCTRINHLLEHPFQFSNFIIEPSILSKLILGYLFQILDFTVPLDFPINHLAFLFVILNDLGLLLEDFVGFGWRTGRCSNSFEFLSFLLGIHGKLICTLRRFLF